jgi:hypothetical protein
VLIEAMPSLHMDTRGCGAYFPKAIKISVDKAPTLFNP